MHCLGFYHEHQRPDRDQYIDIDFGKIDLKHHSALQKLSEMPSYYSTEYDIKSIMHYGSSIQGVYPNDDVMKKKDGTSIEPNKILSPLDIQTLNKMYPCDQTCDSNNSQGKNIANSLKLTRSI